MPGARSSASVSSQLVTNIVNACIAMHKCKRDASEARQTLSTSHLKVAESKNGDQILYQFFSVAGR